MAEPLHVLFVCTANIARSPYAEHRVRQLVRGDTGVVFVSAGVPGTTGRPMDEAMLRELRKRGGAASGHVSRPVDRELMEAADLVLAVEFGQRMRLLHAWPVAASKVYGLRQAAAASFEGAPAGRSFVEWLTEHAPPDSMALDVGDPHMRGRRAARVAADDIDEALAVLLPAMLGRPVPIVGAGPRRAVEDPAPVPWFRQAQPTDGFDGLNPRRAEPRSRRLPPWSTAAPRRAR